LAALVAAASLYTGDLLPEDPYEEWAASPRVALRASFLALLARAAREHEQADDHAAAIATWRRLLTEEPLDEPAHAALIRLLAQTGRRRQALAPYAQFVASLRGELGADPDPETAALAEAIRTGKPRSPGRSHD
jgi:DNA-binding SARP family transcriptional activator